MPIAIVSFISGAITMGFVICAVFFLRSWARTKDYLFAAFALAFLLLALNQTLVTVLGLALEEKSWLYLLRLTAFLVIIAAVLRKNLSK